VHNRGIVISIVMLFAATANVHAQKRFEIAVKPTQFLFNDFELNAGMGSKRKLIGFILSYHPATSDSGIISGAGDRFGGGYTLQNMYNRFYKGYTIGIYRKVNMVSPASVFVETDLFYRNWNFKNKKAEYPSTEGYRFKGTRSENVDVFVFKLLIGKSFSFSKNKPLNLYIDAFTGVGIRYKQSIFETTNGEVMDRYYDYKKDIFREILPSLHLGIKTGIMKRR
jgi:hypothetical protein